MCKMLRILIPKKILPPFQLYIIIIQVREDLKLIYCKFMELCFNLLNKLESLAFLKTIKHISKPSNFVRAYNQYCNQTSKHNNGLENIIPNNSFHTSLKNHKTFVSTHCEHIFLRRWNEDMIVFSIPSLNPLDQCHRSRETHSSCNQLLVLQVPVI